MSYLTLEDHLKEYCPKCKTKHNADWEVKFNTMKAFLVLNCVECNYLVYKKLDVMTSGKKEDMILL